MISRLLYETSVAWPGCIIGMEFIFFTFYFLVLHHREDLVRRIEDQGIEEKYLILGVHFYEFIFPSWSHVLFLLQALSNTGPAKQVAFDKPQPVRQIPRRGSRLCAYASQSHNSQKRPRVS